MHGFACSLLLATVFGADAPAAPVETKAPVEKKGAVDATAPPEAQGPHKIGVSRLNLTDAQRADRKLTTEIWYPAAADPANDDPNSNFANNRGAHRDAPCEAGEFPMIIFSHGSGASRGQSTYLTEHWASHGFIVVAPDHQFNTVFDNANDHGVKSAVDRPLDCTFVIDAMLACNGTKDDRFCGHVDAKRIGATGHSFGGYTVLVLAGATVDGRAASKLFSKEIEPPEFRSRDERVRAIIAYAPVGPPILSTAGLADVKIPALVFGGTNDKILPFEQHQQGVFDNLGGPAFLAKIEGGSHFCFNNANLSDMIRAIRPVKMLEEKVDRKEADRLVKRMSLQFLNRYVAGQEDAGEIAGAPPLLELSEKNTGKTAQAAK